MIQPQKSHRAPSDAVASDHIAIARRPCVPDDGSCELCTRPLPLTFHHLIPRHLHHRRWFRERYTVMEMRLRGAWLCRECHAFIHEHFDEATLGRRLNTVEALKSEPVIARHVEWAARQRVAGWGKARQ